MTKIIPFSGLSGLAGNVTNKADLAAPLQGGVITIGNFDGVHQGHRALLSDARRRADAIGCPTVVVIFDPHPATILRPGVAPPRLTWIERRAELLSEAGIDYLLVCETTQEFLQLSAESFFHSLIAGQLKAKAVVEGPNFFFGRDRGGDVQLLGELCSQNKIDFAVAHPTEDGGELISSTRIRALLGAGKIDEANMLLGTPYRFRGVVARGEQRGGKIGFPTANLSQIDVVTPGLGVYGGHAWIEGKAYEAAIHIGPNPTFDSESQKIEVHVLDFNGDLYDSNLLVDVICHIRDIQRFESADQLVQQINRDIETIRTHLERYRQSTANNDAGPQESKTQ